MPGPFRISFHREVRNDLSSIPKNVAARVLTAIDERLSVAPFQYGERLRKGLRGYWKLRVGDLRIVFYIVGRDVRVYAVMDRHEVYDRIISRLREWREGMS